MVRRTVRAASAVVAGAVTGIIGLTIIASSPVHGAETGGVAAGVVGRLAADLENVPLSFEEDCRAVSYVLPSRAGLERSRLALRQGKPVRILLVGSSSTVGVGASAPDKTYPARLQAAFDTFLKTYNISVIARGISGEVATEMAERVKLEVATHKPHMVIWQVGTNAAIARLTPDHIDRIIDSTVRWLRRNRIDVALIDPQFTPKLSKDAGYRKVVATIAETARDEDVALIQRYEAMAQLAKRSDISRYLARDRFHMNDLGYKCLSAYALGTFVLGVLRAERLIGQRATATSATPASLAAEGAAIVAAPENTAATK